MNFAELTPPKVLIARYHLEALIASPGSLTGHQVQQLEQGLTSRPADGGRVNTQEVLRTKLADLLLLCRDLNGLEETCCRLRYAGVAGVVGYEAIRRFCDIQDGDGEEVIDVRPRDFDGKRLDGFVAVRGLRARFPCYEQIGALVARSAHQVRGILDDARGKIGRTIRWREFMAAQESRYE